MILLLPLKVNTTNLAKSANMLSLRRKIMIRCAGEEHDAKPGNEEKTYRQTADQWCFTNSHGNCGNWEKQMQECLMPTEEGRLQGIRGMSRIHV